MTPTPDTTARTETAETVHNYRVGDPVRIVRNRNTGTAHDHCFQIGTVRHIRALHDDGSGVDLGEWSCGFDEIEPAETAETVTVPRGPLPEGVVTAVVCDYLKMAERDPILREIGPVSLRALWSVLATHFAAAPALSSPQHPVGVREAFIAGRNSIYGVDPAHHETAWEAYRATIPHPPAQDAPGAVGEIIEFGPLDGEPDYPDMEEHEDEPLEEALREILTDGQGDDDGPQIMPDFEEGQSVLSMVHACIALLETRRDVIEGYANTEAQLRHQLATISHTPAQDAPGNAGVRGARQMADDALRSVVNFRLPKVVVGLAQDAPGAVKVKALNDDDFPKEIYVQHPSDADFDGQRWSLHDDFDGQHKAVRYVRADLDPSPPLPEADGEVVAWRWRWKADVLAEGAAASMWPVENIKPEGPMQGDWDVEPLVRQSALVSALRERDEARAELRDEHTLHVGALKERNEERAAREKAEKVAAGYHEFMEDIATTAFMDTVNYRAKLREFANRAMELLRASTEEGKTATPSVKDEEADQDTPPEGYTVEYGSHRSWHAFHRSRRISAWGCKADAIKACWDHVALQAEVDRAKEDERDRLYRKANADYIEAEERGDAIAQEWHSAAAGWLGHNGGKSEDDRDLARSASRKETTP